MNEPAPVSEDPAAAVAVEARRAWSCTGSARLERLGRGLINETFAARGPAGSFVLQRLHRVFSPRIHENIEAVTQRLAARGLETPRLVRTDAGALWLDLRDEGVWRLTTFVEGVASDVVGGPVRAEAAGELVGRFHAALEGLDHAFVDMRVGVHDTAAHLVRLQRAVAEHSAHRLHADVARLADEILAAAAQAEPLPPLPELVAHGDLKAANILFGAPGTSRADRAHCLVDLDTVGPMHPGHELGDALRSWCNPVAEDQQGARVELPIWAAAVRGWVRGRGGPTTLEERRAILLGLEWIALELAARFATDALVEAYFGWDRARWPDRGTHNLARARAQWALHVDAVRTRSARETALARAG
jgi:Ser/Thr protein kinase RdoA (MazF antagonist)